jgi:peptide-methionine (R)-S-oxide reductase
MKAVEKKEKAALTIAQKEKPGPGVYVCSSCRNELFDSAKEFDSRTGFPSFWMHIGDNVRKKFLNTYGRERTQLLCNYCEQHLGHLFVNKNTPTQVRYCINSESISWNEVKV